MTYPQQCFESKHDLSMEAVFFQNMRLTLTLLLPSGSRVKDAPHISLPCHHHISKPAYINHWTACCRITLWAWQQLFLRRKEGLQPPLKGSAHLNRRPWHRPSLPYPVSQHQRFWIMVIQRDSLRSDKPSAWSPALHVLSLVGTTSNTQGVPPTAAKLW